MELYFNSAMRVNGVAPKHRGNCNFMFLSSSGWPYSSE